ncbi:CBS domain-containing protein [Planctomycetes bacterium TBK1r]|uniref:Inosine 5-monophosphate dehydrogenase n=1 Tax=Stieleria magnilauensis TaxID=2527963 RepID=A0ABX5Y3I1_9BACT|nr:inosine 5-monophosphate dehydrogenase [Planctomycetes bacterium TBK1r]
MGFRGELDQDTVGNLPLRDAIAVQHDTTALDAVKLMREKSLGCAVIVDQGGTPTGLFSEQSLVDMLARDLSLADHVVGDFTDAGLLVVRSSDPISRVWDAVERDGLRFVLVTDDEGKLIGVTGQRGIAEYLAERFPQQVLVQRLGNTPWMQQREGA